MPEQFTKIDPAEIDFSNAQWAKKLRKSLHFPLMSESRLPPL